jgi:hypothetical protein
MLQYIGSHPVLCCQRRSYSSLKLRTKIALNRCAASASVSDDILRSCLRGNRQRLCHSQNADQSAREWFYTAMSDLPLLTSGSHRHCWYSSAEVFLTPLSDLTASKERHRLLPYLCPTRLHKARMRPLYTGSCSRKPNHAN